MNSIRQAIHNALSHLGRFLLISALTVRLVVILVYEVTRRGVKRGRFGAFAGICAAAIFLVIAIPACFVILLLPPASRVAGRMTRIGAMRRKKA